MNQNTINAPMTGVIPPPWRAMSARKRSNFGDYAAVIQAPVPGRDPFLVNVARVLGGPQDQAAFANANAAYIVKCVNTYDALVESLRLARYHLKEVHEQAIGDFTETLAAIDRALALAAK